MSAYAHTRQWLARDINALIVPGALILTIWPFVGGDAYALRLLTLSGIYALAAIGYRFIFGIAGALSLAQGGFFGLGAYAAGILAARYGLGFEIGLPAAMLAACGLAAIVALAVLRLQSHYFALATLGVAQLLLLVAVNWEDLTGGANGISGIPLLTLFGVTVGRGWPMLLFVWALVAAGGLAAHRMTGGLARPAYALMREQPMAAAASGIDIHRLRFTALLASAAFAAAAGALQVHTIRVVSPEVLEFRVMVTLLAIAVIGGRTSIAGAILGAVLLVHLPEWFRPLEKYYLVAYGAVLLAVIVAAPWGLVGAATRLRRRFAPQAPPALPAPVPPDGQPTPATLEIRGLVKHFGGVRAVDFIDLAIGPGEAVGVVGANGSGKTTLANLIAGAETPESGNIRWGGAEITGLAPHRIARAGIARTFQTLQLVDAMSALDNIVAGYRRGGSLDVAHGEAAALVRMLGIADYAWRDCGGLPPGIRRRVEIARALIGGPALLLLDEPAAGLTQGERDGLAVSLRGFSATGATLVVIEHDLDFLSRIAGRLVCLERGRIIADGPPDAVRDDPAVIAAWLGAVETGHD